MLRVEHIYCSYGSLPVLRDVSVSVEPGEIVAVIGANGAGKSTLLRTISGLIHPNQGRVTFDGRDITNAHPEKVVALGVSQVCEGRQVFAGLTVLDNLELGTFHRYRKASRKDFAEDLKRVFSLFPRLEERIEQRAGTLSGGEQQMLAIGRALMARPNMLLMDEPSLGLAPLIRNMIFDVTVALNKAGTSILLVEQNARAALAMADRAYVLEIGRVALSGSGKELMNNEEVKRSYLGI